jgi:hypothetical protein
MPNNITRNTRIYNAAQFVESVGEEDRSNLYVFVGHAQARLDEENIANVSLLRGESINSSYNMLAAKKVNRADVCHVVPRINWAIGQIYDFYDDRDQNIDTKQFYVMNSNYDVYVCLWNNNRQPSTSQPISRSSRSFEMPDGYKWKYLYTIEAADQLRFLTSRWMPVRSNSVVQRSAVDGKIEVIIPQTFGSDYDNNKANNIITVQGDGEGLLIDHELIDNQITEYVVLDGGAGYKYANINVIHTLGLGQGATSRIVIPPKGGHGANPIAELFARYVMLNSRIEYAEGFSDFPTDVEYRTIGIVKDPKDIYGNPVDKITANANYVLRCTVDSGADFRKNQYITGNISGANAFIVTSNVVNSTTVDVRYIQGFNLTENFKSFNIGEEITASNTSSIGVVTEIAPPEIVPYSGEILYIDRRPPVTRAPDQAENIHIVIAF